MVVVVDYGIGNLGSIANMLKKVGARAVVSSEIAHIEQADKLILPGMGAFDNGMKNLQDLGLVPILREKVLGDRTPLLGLCLGMQLLTQQSEEGNLPGLGWIEASTTRFRFGQAQPRLKVPHMGWNGIEIKQHSPILEDLYGDDVRFYFVHSYHVVCHHDSNVLATTVYGHEFTSAIISGNIIGTQFHPEKSHKFGMKLLKNFVERF
jgi:glutamine amidotransferase